MTKDSIVSVIQHLLNKTIERGCTEGEAEAALKKAQQLMIEHNLSLLEVKQAEVEKADWVEEEAWEGKGLPWDMQFVVHLLQDHFFVKAVFRRGYRGSGTKVILFGDKENVEVAKHLLIFLSRTFRQLWQNHKWVNDIFVPGGRRNSRMFYIGLRDGLSAKLTKEREVQVQQAKKEGALIVVEKALVKAFEKHFPTAKSMGQKAVSGSELDYTGGVQAGKKINIQGTMGQEGSRKRLS